MSRKNYNNFINQNNKILFESRLQMKNNSILKLNKNLLSNNTHKNNNISFINSTCPFINEISCKKKNIQTTFENSYQYNIKNNISINKNLKKNRNKKNNLNKTNGLNKSNIITFFHLKKKPIILDNKQNKTFINANKKMIYFKSNNRSLNIKNKENNERKMIINLKKSKNYNNLHNKEIISFNSMIKSMKMINDNNNINNYTLNKYRNDSNIYNKLRIKEKNDSKHDFKNNQNVYSRNSSSVKDYKNNSNRYNSFVIDKIKKIKYEQKFYFKNNKSIQTYNSNQRGRNLKKDKNKKEIDEYNGQTHRNFFTKKNFGKIYKNSFKDIIYNNNINSMIKKQKNKINIQNKENKSNLNMNINNKIYNNNCYKKLLIKKEDNKISRNYKNNINKKLTYNKFKNNKDTNGQQLITFDNVIKNNIDKIYHEFENNNNNIKKNNNQSIMIKSRKSKKNMNKHQEVIEDNNGVSTKTNEEFFTETTNKNINETTIEEDSGILSIKEIEDIINYNNMKDVDTSDDFLFYDGDHINFLGKYKSKINNIFFTNNHQTTYRLSKIKIRKRIIINKENIIKDDEHKNKFNYFKVLTHNNSAKRKK